MATESTLRKKPVTWLAQYEGIKEGSFQHQEILDVFNNSKLCTRYKMTVNDAWCATAVSSAFIASDLSSIFPCVECSCANMITLAKDARIWQENDGYVPEVGDCILYDWQDTTGSTSDNTGNPDHVGIVSEISGSSFKVIEGNKSNTVGYRDMTVNGTYIRGYITPTYSSLASDATENVSTLQAGDKITLNKANLYASANAAKSSGTKTGTYYLWDNVTQNGRVRITNSTSNVGKSGQVTGWVDVSSFDGVVEESVATSSSSTSSSSTSSSSTSSSSSSSSSKPSYKVGTVYTLKVDRLTVRTGAGTSNSAVSYSNLTSDAKKHAYSNGTLKKGTSVTCKATKTVGSDIWMQIPSGWVAAWYNSQTYVG